MDTAPRPAGPRRPRRSRTGNRAVDEQLSALVDALGDVDDRELVVDILATAARLAMDGAARLDLKITSAALREMRTAFRAFAPYRDIPKVTIFGSARTHRSDPGYEQAREVAARLAAAGWMVITGAGPGIMAAGLEGAGRERSFGVNIRLPFEQSANEFIRGDEKLVSMKYFFTRKLMLIKESRGFVSLPGGFGTQDETFELLTLQQTGKAEPAPIVLLDEPGGSYWQGWLEFVNREVVSRRLIDEQDHALFSITDDADAAATEIVEFFRNYHSIRWVDDLLVIRLAAEPTEDDIDSLNDRFADVCVRGRIERSGPLPPELADQDRLDKPRIVLAFDNFRHGRLRELIDALNVLPSAPAVAPLPPP
jgi:uncharacterized protein (TIGR00730 family)